MRVDAEKWGCFFAISGLNRVGVDRHGLILWENEAMRLGIIFKYPSRHPKHMKHDNATLDVTLS